MKITKELKEEMDKIAKINYLTVAEKKAVWAVFPTITIESRFGGEDKEVPALTWYRHHQPSTETSNNELEGWVTR